MRNLSARARSSSLLIPAFQVAFAATGLSLLVGCGSATTSFVKSDTTLGKIIVYRNGVAYFERSATVTGDTLSLAAPADKVDDFLKSLTVTDAKTGEPAPISYPSSNGGTVDLKISLPGPGPHEVRLSYVTEAPAWKPSYRITIPKSGKFAIQAWAVVDNTSGEDWQNVRLGVGSSSAMSFRFNLRGLRTVDRQTLRADDLFAMAPPTGGSTYGGDKEKAYDFTEDAIAQNEMAQNAARDESRRRESAPVAAASTSSRGPSKAAPPASPPPRPSKPGDGWNGAAGGLAGAGYPAEKAASPQPQGAGSLALHNTAEALKRSSNTIVVEGYATSNDGDKTVASLERANKLRDQLIREGVDPQKVVAQGMGEQAGHAGGARIVEKDLRPKPESKGDDAKKGQAGQGSAAADPSKEQGDPIGTSHFESKSAMTVPKGSSAMVSVYKGETDGEIVYLYDAESARGNANYPFKSVRFANPTDSQLEQGPVTVFGEGRFIGEGMSEPIPARTNAFVPYALDRQIVVEQKSGEKDEIARIITVQRGVFSTEIKHTRHLAYTLHNRSGDKAVVYVKHTVPAGYKLAPSVVVAEKLGNANLLRIELAPNAKSELEFDESTPIFRSTDLRTPDGLNLIRAYASSGALDGSAELRAQVSDLIRLQTEMANHELRIQTLREQLGEYRTRMDELHAQIVTLRLVKTAGPIMANLEKKLQEVSDRVSRATVDVVDTQEKLMVARIKFQDGVAELSLEKKVEPAPAVEKKTDDKKPR